jgi:hypothetical protein
MVACTSESEERTQRLTPRSASSGGAEPIQSTTRSSTSPLGYPWRTWCAILLSGHPRTFEPASPLPRAGIVRSQNAGRRRADACESAGHLSRLHPEFGSHYPPPRPVASHENENLGNRLWRLSPLSDSYAEAVWAKFRRRECEQAAARGKPIRESHRRVGLRNGLRRLSPEECACDVFDAHHRWRGRHTEAWRQTGLRVGKVRRGRKVERAEHEHLR